jgi:hypothetical protein
MHRTQLYLDEQLWNALRARAHSAGTTISELVRTAVRDRYLGNLDERRQAMEALVGLRRDRDEFHDSDAYVRRLRRGTRLDDMEHR